MTINSVIGEVMSFFLQEFVQRITDGAADTIGQVYSSDIKGKLQNLEATYERVQVMLNSIHGWDLIVSKPRRDWLADVLKACYEVEDFLDELQNQILDRITDANFLTALFTEVKASHNLHKMQSDLLSLITQSNSLHNFESSETKQHNLTEPVAVLDDGIFKRTKDKHDIVHFFLQPRTGSSDSNIATVSIIGMFGVGKTTLAHAVKNDPQIQGRFQHRLWVSVSGSFDLGEALRLMVKNMQDEWNDSMQQDPFSGMMIQKFQDLCKGKQILIVLDDLCNFLIPQKDWKDFEHILHKSSSSMFCVIITTRNPKVATTVASSREFPTLSQYMEPMSDEDCASIIQRSFKLEVVDSKRTQSGRTKSKVYALSIAQLCKGLPLMASIMCHYVHENHSFFAPSTMKPEDLWNMPECKDQIFPTFRLNYSDLSKFLKRCLPHFSLFPDKYKFNKDELTQLWSAEGLMEFIRTQASGVQCSEYPLENLGSYAFDEVLSQSILQIYSPCNQEPQIYIMHEFIHWYAKCIASDLYVMINEQFDPRRCQLGKASHVSFLCQRFPERVWEKIEKCGGLRTILSLHDDAKIGQMSYTLFLKLQRLRVLVLRKTDITKLSESLGKLKHLRLLDVSETEIEDLPSSTTVLYRLQFLKLNFCHKLLGLPKDIANLTQLLHLEVDMKGLSLMPPHMGKLTRLRTLNAFKVGREDGHRVTELENLKYLTGSICLTNLENVRGEVEAREAMLINKPLLKTVELEWKRQLTNRSLAENILASFEPHAHLEQLLVTGYSGQRFPNWLSTQECNLTSIHLLRCYQCDVLPVMGKLPHLKTLVVEKMYKVKYIDDHLMGSGEGAGFPSLESLKFLDMRNLEIWEGLEANQMPNLHSLVISDCPKLTFLPSLNLLTSLVTLEITNCPMLEALPEGGVPLSLQTIAIADCEILSQRCLPEQGLDWDKVKTIPNRLIS